MTNTVVTPQSKYGLRVHTSRRQGITIEVQKPGDRVSVAIKDLNMILKAF